MPDSRVVSGRMPRCEARALPVEGWHRSVVLLTLLLILSCTSHQPPTPPPATVTQPRKEAELTTVQLSAEAEARLDIPAHLYTLRRQTVPRSRRFGGEIMLMPGRAALMVAPINGTVLPPEEGSPPVAGLQVKAGQLLATVVPLLTPLDRVQVATALSDAEGQLARAQIQLDAAELQFARAARLLAEQATGTKALEEARAQRDTAQAELAAARARRDSLAGRPGRPGVLGAVRIEAPMTGVLRDVRAAPRQQVATGAGLFEVIADDPVWIRVAVAAAEFDDVETAAPAQITSLTPGTNQVLLAPPVRPAPPTAAPQQSTMDLYFALPNPQHRLRPGQRVGATLNLRGSEEGAVAPLGAVLYDTAGDPWVYESVGAGRFVRRRVAILRVAGELAVLDDGRLDEAGLKPGAHIVTAGAAELWGVEFGAGK